MEPVAHIPKTPTPPAQKPQGPNFADKLRDLAQSFLKLCHKIFKAIAKTFKRFGAFLKRSWKKFLRHFTKWIDPKLEPYRTHPRGVANPAPESNPKSATALDDTPKTRADIFAVLSQAPHGIFSQRERNMIDNLLNLPLTKTSEIMLPATKIVYVNANEVLGPLTLDRLYRSGLSHFPVKDSAGELIGCVHTTHFNNLEIRESRRVSDILDPGLYFVRDDYSLEQTLSTFLRTNALFLLVTDRYGKIVGLVTFNDFIHHLFGTNPKDAFDRDTDRLAVASRRG